MFETLTGSDATLGLSRLVEGVDERVGEPRAPERAPAVLPTLTWISRPLVEVVLPLADDVRPALPAVRALHHRLHESFPYPLRLTLVDGSGSESSWLAARHLALALPGVFALRSEQRQRGAACRLAWSLSDAEVVAVGELDAIRSGEELEELVVPLLANDTDLVVGTRRWHTPDRRGRRRRLPGWLSVAVGLGRQAESHRLRPAFIAVHPSLARELLEEVTDDRFLDHLLLALAERNELRILDVPVVGRPGRTTPAARLRRIAERLEAAWSLARQENHALVPRLVTTTSRVVTTAPLVRR
jgi:hypothetical protein